MMTRLGHFPRYWFSPTLAHCAPKKQVITMSAFHEEMRADLNRPPGGLKMSLSYLFNSGTGHESPEHPYEQAWA